VVAVAFMKLAPNLGTVVQDGFLVDAIRGKVPFGTYTNALIPWPKSKQALPGRGGQAMILCGDLLRALQKESIPTICHHWGVGHSAVSKWRRALGMTSTTKRTAGAQRLMSLGVELARLPESRAKKAEAGRGRWLTGLAKWNLHEAARLRRRERFEARRAAYFSTGQFGKASRSTPWIPEEDALLLRKLPTKKLVRVLGRTARAISERSRVLDSRAPRPVGHPSPQSHQATAFPCSTAALEHL
jgi:hypothetical protein